MRTHHVGDLVVIEEQNGRRIPVGIVTDRDIVIEVLAKNINLDAVVIGDVMSFDLVTVQEEDDVFDTIERMRTKGVRRVPVVDSQGGLVGILAVDDLIDLVAELLWDVSGLIAQEQKRERRARP
jgi:CBS domain-containing protein